jgi:hypothetical protein
MEIGLHVLMRDGAVRVAFHPRVTPQQHAEFIEPGERSNTRDELCDGAEAAARRWGIRQECEPVGL